MVIWWHKSNQDCPYVFQEGEFWGIIGKVLRRGSNGRLLSGKGHKGTFGDNGNILCLDCSGIYIGIKISQNELNCN